MKLESLKLEKFQKNALTISQIASIYGGAIDTRHAEGTDTHSVTCSSDCKYDYKTVYNHFNDIEDMGTVTKEWSSDVWEGGYGELG